MSRRQASSFKFCHTAAAQDCFFKYWLLGSLVHVSRLPPSCSAGRSIWSADIRCNVGPPHTLGVRRRDASRYLRPAAGMRTAAVAAMDAFFLLRVRAAGVDDTVKKLRCVNAALAAYNSLRARLPARCGALDLAAMGRWRRPRCYGSGIRRVADTLNAARWLLRCVFSA